MHISFVVSDLAVPISCLTLPDRIIVMISTPTIQDRKGTPSQMMERSFLYRLHGHKIKPGVEADPEKFQEVFRSKYGKVRIFKILGVSEESKQWVSNPANRVCDVAGSWFCPGQYPPGLSHFLSRKRDFAQLEDFNRGGESDEDYQKQYFEALENPDLARARARALEQQARAKDEPGRDGASKPPSDIADQLYKTWEDTEETTLMWRLISSNAVDDLRSVLEQDSSLAFVRSKDGRGPMWWAFESRNQEIVKMLMKLGVPHMDKDANGRAPVDILEGQ